MEIGGPLVREQILAARSAAAEDVTGAGAAGQNDSLCESTSMSLSPTLTASGEFRRTASSSGTATLAHRNTATASGFFTFFKEGQANARTRNIALFFFIFAVAAVFILFRKRPHHIKRILSIVSRLNKSSQAALTTPDKVAAATSLVVTSN